MSELDHSGTKLKCVENMQKISVSPVSPNLILFSPKSGDPLNTALCELEHMQPVFSELSLIQRLQILPFSSETA